MKISKIASVALFSGLLVSSASATLNTSSSTLLTSVKSAEAIQKAQKALSARLQTLNGITHDQFKNYNKANTTASVTTSAAQAKANTLINEFATAVTNYDVTDIANSTEIIVGGDKKGNVQLKLEKDSSGSKKIYFGKVTTDNKPISSWTELTDIGTNLASNLVTATFNLFSDISGVILADLAKDAKKEAEADITVANAKAYLDDILSNGSIEAFNSDSATPADVVRINSSIIFADVVNKSIDDRMAIAKLVQQYNATGATEATKKSLLEQINAKLQSTGLTLNSKTGKTSSLAEATDVTDTYAKALVEELFTASTVLADTSSKTTFALASEFKDLFNTLLSDIANVSEVISNVETKKSAVSVVTLDKSITDAIANNNVALAKAELLKQAKALQDKKTEAETINSGSNNDAQKKAFIQEAAKLGVKFQSKTSSGTEITAANVAKIIADTSNFVLSEAFSAAKTAIETAAAEYQKSGNAGQIDGLLTALDTVIRSADGRINAISNYKTTGANSSVVQAFGDIQANNVVAQAVNTASTDSIVALASSLSSSANELTKNIGNTSALNSVRFNNDSLQAARLAKLANPFNKDLALAKAINRLEAESFADNGSALSSVVKGYSDRFNSDNNVWANVIGSKVVKKDALNPELYGLSVGYDKAFDDLIVGTYLSYAKSKADSSTLDVKADNYEFGLYARKYIDQNEIDAKISYGFAKNDVKTSAFNPVSSEFISNSGKYDSKLINLEATYGYVFDLSDALYVKPLIGLSYENRRNDTLTQSGDLPFEVAGYNTNTFLAKLGVEFRKYLSNGNYFYVTPAVQSELSKSGKDLDVKFVGSNTKLVVESDNKKKTYAILNAGAKAHLSENLSLETSVGVKSASKEQHYNATLGLRYSF